MVGRVVGDVAGAVLLLDATDAVHEARGARHGPRPGQRVGVAQVGPELRVRRRRRCGWARWRRAPRCRAGSRRRAAATARSRWRGSRRTAAITGVRYLRAMRAASMAASKQCAGLYGGDDRHRRLAVAAVHGHAADRLPRSWSGRPVDGPPRWMSMISSGSSRLTARPMVSDLSAMPGPLVVVTPRWPPKAAPRAAPMPAISSSACSVRTPKFLCFDSSWRMSDAGVIGYDAEEQRQPGQLAGGDEAPRQGGVAVDVGVGARPRASPGWTSNGWSNSSAVSPNAWPALNAARLASRTCGLAWRTSRRSSRASARRAGCTSSETSPRAKKFFDRSASRGFTPSGAHGLLGEACVIGTS